MKKILSFLLVAILSLGLSACTQGENPEKVVNDYFSVVKSFDIESVNKLVESGNSNQGKEISEEDKEFIKKLFSYTSVEILGQAKIEGKTAKVDTKITAPDMEVVFESVMEEFIPKVMNYAFEGKVMSEKESNKLFREEILKQLESKDLAMTTSEVELKLVKKNGSWLVREDEVLANAISGGLIRETKELENKFK